MPNDGAAADPAGSIDELRSRLAAKNCEMDALRAELRDARMTGIAVGVLLARTPGWTEHDALEAWDRACAQLTRGGNTNALASYVVQTGQLPGTGVTENV